MGMARPNPRWHKAVAAVVVVGTLPGLSACGSFGAWYSDFNTSSRQHLDPRYSGGQYRGSFISANFDGGGEELLIFAAVYGGILLVAGAIELGEYCIDYCSSWFD